MAIRFRKYKNKVGDVVSALRLTEKNVEELVSYITTNKGTAIDETRVFHSPDLKDGQYTAVKLALVQVNTTPSGTRRGVRKAYANDVIIRTEVELPSGKPGYAFSRVKSADFEEYAAV